MSVQQAKIIARRDLKGDQPIAFDITPDAKALEVLAAELDLVALRKLRLKGALHPVGRADWEARAHLGATVVQPCVVTLAPVTTRIETDVTRLFVPQIEVPEGEEIEIPQEDSPEPLGRGIDLHLLMTEALALALPDYPRAEGAELGQAVFTEPGAQPMTDEDARPFAALKGLRDQLQDDD